MQINVSTQQGRVPITILQLNGDLDASNYIEPIQQAQELYTGGARDLIVDLGNVPYISSSGLMAIHMLALIFGGRQMTGTQSRPSFHAVDPKRDQSIREHVKLLNPQSQVDQVLEMVGLKMFFQIYKDLDSAVKSF
ncbi:MAG: STAS domain-containing protein [Anaerolineales bacterium]|nr:STAS domain-containing protein [Anaerolineales bacterium]